jgi:hypothetical protein
MHIRRRRHRSITVQVLHELVVVDLVPDTIVEVHCQETAEHHSAMKEASQPEFRAN